MKPHRAWAMAGLTFSILVASAAFRSTTGVLLEPLEREFGWSRATTSGAASINLLVYGLAAPFAATLMDRFSMRRVASIALGLIAAGCALTVVMAKAWQLYLAWGLLVGLGTGSLALVFGSLVANRWFERRRGLVTGIFSAAYATGQLIFLPTFARFTLDQGWRWASAGVSIIAAALIVPVAIFFRDRPEEVGLGPYGAATGPAAGVPTMAAAAEPPSSESAAAAPLPPPRLGAVAELGRAARSFPFWILAGTFFVCGWSTNGLIGTHFIPAAHDHGMPIGTAASLLALVGIFDLVGTIASGWLTDKVDSVWLLLSYYGLRGLALFSAPFVLGPTVEPPLLFFIVFYGLDWVATVPPTLQLCRKHFGITRSTVVYGWVFAAHMVGASIAAAYAGAIRQSTGSYTIAWLTAAGLCIAAALAVLSLRGRSPYRAETIHAHDEAVPVGSVGSESRA